MAQRPTHWLVPPITLSPKRRAIATMLAGALALSVAGSAAAKPAWKTGQGSSSTTTTTTTTPLSPLAQVLQNDMSLGSESLPHGGNLTWASPRVGMGLN